MNMVWHDHESMHTAELQNVYSMKKYLDHHIGDPGLAQINRTGPRLIQQPINGGKCFSRRQ